LRRRTAGREEPVRRLLTALALVGVIAVAAVPAEAGTRDGHKHKRAGIRGVVVNGTCLGPCTEPKPIHPAYAEPVTITVRRASNGVQVARRETSNGKFRMRVKRGLYDVSAIPPGPPPCIPTPTSVCPAQGADSSKQVIVPCLMGETKRVRVKRHRVTYVELHMRNVCIV
jgi:hypothetical protein